MTDLSFSVVPTTGVNNASDVSTPLNEVKAYVNGAGWVNGARIAAATVDDSNLVSPNNSAYKTIMFGSGQNIGGTGATGVHIWYPGITASTPWQQSGFSTATALPLPWRFASTDYAVAGKTTKFRLKMNVIVGSTSPSTVTFTLGLYPLSISAGTAVAGTVVTGSTALSSGLATNNIYPFTSGDFSASALLTDPGNYVIGVNVGSISAPNGIGVAWELQYRHV